MLREAILEGFVKPLADLLEGPNAKERAELVGCNLLGMLVYRTVVGASSQDVDQQVALVAPGLQALIDGDAFVAAAKDDGKQND